MIIVDSSPNMETQTALPPVQINGHIFQPRDEIHRRKLEALRVFVERLLASPAREQIGKIILFGSVARGEAREESDVDVMVFGFADLNALDRITLDQAYDTLLEHLEHISALVTDATELFEPQTYLNYRVSNFGQEVYAMTDEQLKRREIQDRRTLAEDYLRSAEDAYRSGHWRLAADAAYNAAEACAKALLLLKMADLPSSHGGIIQKFSEYYIKDGPAPPSWGSRLNQGLKIRGDARYSPAARITQEQVEHNLDLARQMIGFVENILSSNTGEQEDRPRP